MVEFEMTHKDTMPLSSILSARRPIGRVLLITSETNCGYLVLLSTRKKFGRDV